MALPTGTVTFLFSDIEGSTHLARSMSTDSWAALAQAHDDLADTTIEAHHGVVVKHEGDGMFAAFGSAIDAMTAAAALSRAVATSEAMATGDPGDTHVRLRIGIHTGIGQLTRDGGDYVGVDVHYASRVAGAGNGGQIVVSDATRAVLTGEPPPGTTLIPAGSRRLKDFDEPKPLHRLVVPGAADDERPLRAAGNVELPTMLTSFVGREVEVAAVAELLGRSRIVSLTGPGGTGKTRLSVGVAEVVADRFPDGAVFVELAPIRDPALVASAVGAAVGVAEAPGDPIAEVLRRYLDEKVMLLVLDNLEQLLPAAASIVADLVHGAAGLRVLISTREPLRVSGEQEYQVPPLGASEAEALFLDRARLARPDFVATGDEAVAVAGIARQLDGLPLAIELAAARVRVFPPTRILERLGHSLDLLTTGARDLPERQRTLRGAIGWSYDLLPSPEQTLFRRLAVLVGDWTTESADGIADADRTLGVETFDGLTSLVDKSLLRIVPTAHGDPMFGRHAFVREYAWERLEESGERPLCESRHGTVFRDLAITAGPHLTEAGAERYLDLLDHAIHDLRHAMAGSLDSGDVEIGLSIVGSAWRWWQIRAHLREGRDWAERLLGHPNAAGDSIGRLLALAAAGGLAYWSNDYAATRAAYVERLALAERIGDPYRIADAHYDLGFVGVVEQDIPLIRRETDQALALFEQLGDRAGIIRSRQSLVVAHFLSGDARTAAELEEQNLEDFRSTQSWFRVADGLMLLGAIARLDGRPTDAIESARSALRTLPERVGGSTVGALGVIAVVEGESGDAERAARLAGAIRAIQAETGEALAAVTVLHLPHPADVVRERLGTEVAESLMAQGATLNVDEAIALALGEAG
ncbi:MAG: adenylate/guanylate cyclase domain-containing protein [Candidatus Limnocylindrales bacterium]